MTAVTDLVDRLSPSWPAAEQTAAMRALAIAWCNQPSALLILNGAGHLRIGRGLESLGPAALRTIATRAPYFRAAYLLVTRVARWKRTGRADFAPIAGLPQDDAPAVLATLLFRFLTTGRLTESPVKLVGDLRLPIDTVIHSAIALKNLGLMAEAERLEFLWGTVEQLLRNAEDVLVLSPMFLENIGHAILTAGMIEGQRMGYFRPQRTAAKPETPHNRFLCGMLSRYFEPLPATYRFGEILNTAKLLVLPGGRRMEMMELVSEAGRVWAEGGRPFLTLDEDVLERGWANLARFGVKRGDRLVTLHVREQGYHSYGDRVSVNEAELNHIRNAPIETYAAAVERIIANGGTVVRLGNPGMTEIGHRPGFIDYPFTDFRCDWMDIFLASQCHYNIGSSSGMSFVPILFGRSVLFTNYITLASMIDSPSVVTLFKPLRDRANRLVPFEEHARRFRYVHNDIELDFHGITHAYNEPEDIDEAVALMERYVDPVSGLLQAPDEVFRAGREAFARSAAARRPNIPPGFWERLYGSRADGGQAA